MRTYVDKEELVAQVRSTYAKFIIEFDDVPEDKRNVLLEPVDKTPSQILAYQIGWLSLLLAWEQQEKRGQTVITPTAEYKWNNLGGLYQKFYLDYDAPISQQCKQLDQLVADLCTWVLSLSSTELFGLHQRQWANNDAQWPLWKWIHINSVAPFTNFRPKIRKWKKLNKITATDG